MWKFGTAVAALILGAVVGAVTVRSGQAQEATEQAEAARAVQERVYIEGRESEGRRILVTQDGRVIDKEGVPILEDIPLLGELFLQRTINKVGEGETRVQAAPAAPTHFMMPHAAPGTWQLHSHGDHLVLLNTTDGRAFRLDGEGDRAAWKPLPAPPRGTMPMAASVIREVAKPAEADATAMRRQVAALEMRLKDLREQLMKIEEGLDNAGEDAQREELNKRAAELRDERHKVSSQLRAARARLKAAESKR